MHTAPNAFNDDFNILEDVTDLGENVLFANLFDDNGSGADSDPDMDTFTVTQLNGVTMTPSGFHNLEVGFRGNS